MAHTVQLGNIIGWTLYQTLGIFANHEDLSTNLLYFTYSIVYKNSLDREDFLCMGVVSNLYSILEDLYFHYIVCTFAC